MHSLCSCYVASQCSDKWWCYGQDFIYDLSEKATQWLDGYSEFYRLDMLSGPSLNHSTSASVNLLKVPHSRIQATSNQSLSSDPGIPRLGI